jgi:hypothetical protein
MSATPAAISASSDEQITCDLFQPPILLSLERVAVSGLDEGGAVERYCSGSGVAYSVLRNRGP